MDRRRAWSLERSPRSQHQATIWTRYAACWTSWKRGGQRNEYAPEPSVDGASGVDASAFSVAGNTGGSPLRARPGVDRWPYMGPRPLCNGLRCAVGDDCGTCGYILVAGQLLAR